MPDSRLEELKKGVKTTPAQTKSTSEKAKNKQPFVPGIVNPETNELEEPIGGQRIDLSSGKLVRGRTAADLSQLPKPKDESIKDHTPVDDILAEGGVFDKYVAEKKKEMQERLKDEVFADDETEQMEDAEYVDTSVEKESALDEEERELEDMYESESTEYVEDDEFWDEQEDDRTEDVESESQREIRSGMELFEDDYEYKDDYSVPSDEELFGEDDFELEDQVAVEESDNVQQVEETEENIKSDIKVVTKKMSVSLVKKDNNEEELAELEFDDSDEDPEEKRQAEEFQAEVTEKIKPVVTKLDLSSFTVMKKGTMSDKVLNNVTRAAAKWVLPNSGIIFEMTEISGSDIEYIRENYQGSDPNNSRNVLRILYDHIRTPKPTTFEGWLKSIAFADYDHLFMCVYIAAFNDANYIPYNCEKVNRRVRNNGCGNMFLSDNVPVMEMVKFKDLESRNKFNALYNSNRVNSKGLYATERVPISDILAVGLKVPTLHSVLFETSSFSTEFRSKYARTIQFVPYIDDMYQIDKERGVLIPIEYKEFANNAGKTAKSKVIRYAKYIESLTTDEFSYLMALVNAIDDKFDWFTYQIPETTCPKCGKKIEAQQSTAANLVFTRHRLAILANSSIK